MIAKLYFEAHITIDPIFDERREMVSKLAQAHGFRLAKLFMEKGKPSELDTFMTGHGKDLNDIKNRMSRLIWDIGLKGIKVRRYKIEDTVMDSRSHDVLGLLNSE